MKKFLAMILALALCVSLVACGGAASSTATGTSAAPSVPEAKQSVAGVCWYNFGDTFIANARTTLNDLAAADGAIKVIDADSTNDTSVQTNNVNNFYTQGVDYMVINNINTNAKAEMIEQAKEKGVTLVFANSDSPSEEEFALYDNVYHVSSAAEQSGTIIGEQIAAYWKAHPEADRNGDGKLNYVMLLGLQQHYDTRISRFFKHLKTSWQRYPPSRKQKPKASAAASRCNRGFFCLLPKTAAKALPRSYI